eukprot:TRINITY_DN23977_c0_g1_i1.p1 TRINITY_DN23977_c0_g1~~TRINITY_DN23977_c0_g1_i1.p1  ORF type:complete len:297 (-),score=58.48 TRINITY_DN23977_c0_g1_i1:283-1041(-)
MGKKKSQTQTGSAAGKKQNQAQSVAAVVAAEKPDTTYQFDTGFWDKKYESTGESQEWLLGYADIASFFEAVVKDKGVTILVLGCGDAPFSADLHAAGYQNVTNVDNSAVVIEKMAEKHPEMTWVVADATNMEGIADEAYDVIIEKTLVDNFVAIKGGDKDFLITNMWAEVWRALRPGGRYFSLNFIMESCEKGWTRRALDRWSEQIGEAMGRSPWKIMPFKATASNIPQKMRQDPACFVCTKPADLSISSLQ